MSFIGLAGSRNVTHTNRDERQVGRGCLTNTYTKREGGSGPVCLASTKPDGGVVFIVEKTIRE